MRAVTMTWQDRAAAITEIEHRVARAIEEGAQYGPLLLQEPPAAWRRMMRNDVHFRGFGTLRFLLEAARARFETEPTVAHQITAAVLDFVGDMEGPSRVHEIGLRGLAWKEHANACEIVGNLRDALSAAERAVAIYDELPALLFDQTRARLVACKVLREMGETAKAMELARECAAIFLDFGDLTATNMARMFEGGVLFSTKQFAEALVIFTEVMAQAEADGDRVTVARCLHCAAECARELGKLDAARDLYPRALAHFEELNIRDDANSVRWGYALCLAAEGKVRFAISELFKVCGIFLSLGMNGQAASAALDIVRLQVDLGEDVRDLCVRLVTMFTDAGMAQNAIEALAYLREQAKDGRLTQTKIGRLRTYFGELTKKPNLLFARPPEGEEG
jgi:tetratricopeptide (TPR) repeat protein